MHISELQISNFKSFKSHAKLQNLSKNINIIVGKNGSGKSNITTAFSTILNPSKLMTDQKHALINESNVINQNKALIQIEILNNDRFPLKERVVLRRDLDAKKDTYSIVENDLTNKIDDPVSLFENANITNNNYFVVQQGKINHFALMNDNERLELIKEIAGANVYEKDRKHCVQLMFETERSNEKTNEMLKTINEKLLMLQKEKKKLIELENLEKEKSKIEIAIFKKEKEQIDNELNKLNIVESFVANESNDIDEIQEEIMYCKKQIEEMKDIGSASDINMEEVTKERDELEKQRNALESQYSELLKRQENNEQIMLGAKTNIEICKQKSMYYNKIVSSKEFMNYTQEHERHTKALEDLTKIAAQYKETSKVDAYKELQNKIMERNRLWTEEKKLKDKRQEVYSDYLRLERSFMFLGGGKYKEYSNIKNSPGVHGCVFELLTIPEELISAFESVAANSLFNVVVDNDEVATELCKKIDCRLTFIPLNRIKDNYEEIQLEDAFLLSSKISCKNIYKPILNYVTKNTYLTSDIKTGFLLSKTHNINIVTLDGDFISRKGFVSGGSDKKNSFMKDFKSKELEIKIYDKKMLDIKVKTNAITAEIEDLQKNKNFEMKPLSKHEYDLEVNVLHAKVSIVKSIIENGYNEKTVNKAIEENKKQQKALEAKINNIENDTSNLSSELASLKLKKEIVKNKHLEISNKYDSCIKYKKYVSLVNKITELKKLEQECNDKENQAIYQYSDYNNDARENKLKRDILIEKKLNLMRKIGRNCNTDYDDLSQSELYNQIKAINEKIKKLSNINKKALMMFEDYYDQKNKLQERLIELQEERVKIDGFISDLDRKKTDTVNLTFKMIKDNFSYFYTKLSPKNNAELRLIDDGVSVKINDELITDLKKLSGGQKALLALSLIFSIQKIDPSPFYFFDEIDAHLDEQSRLNVSKLIQELSQMEPFTQFFIVSFRKEMISVGDKFYGVDFEDNNSIVKEIGKEEALNFVSDEMTSNE